MEKCKLKTSQDVVKLLALDYAFALLACAKGEGLLEDGITCQFVTWAFKYMPKATKQDAQSTNIPVVQQYLRAAAMAENEPLILRAAAMAENDTLMPSPPSSEASDAENEDTNVNNHVAFAERLVEKWSNSSNETVQIIKGLIEQAGPAMQVTDRPLHTMNHSDSDSCPNSSHRWCASLQRSVEQKATTRA